MKLMILALIITGSLHAPSACYPIQPSGEGFPQVRCIDGSIWYQDMDGTDGSHGSVGDGVWVKIGG